MQKQLGSIVVLYFTSHFYVNLIDQLLRISMSLLINTVLGQVSIIANDMVFLKNQQLFNAKMAWRYCISVLYLVLKHFYVNFNRQIIDKINALLINTVLGQVSIIANDMVFLKNYQLFNAKMAWLYCSSVLYVVFEHFNVNLIDSF